MRRIAVLFGVLTMSCSDDGLAPPQDTDSNTSTAGAPGSTGRGEGEQDSLDLETGGGSDDNGNTAADDGTTSESQGTSSGGSPAPTDTTDGDGTGETTGETDESSSGETGGTSTGETTGTSTGEPTGTSTGMDDECPAIGGTTVIGGPADLYGFCWYLGAPGDTCDTVCGELGEMNLGLVADAAYPDNCLSADVDDVSTWFFNNGNPGGWTAIGGATSARTLGYGYSMVAQYYGKCSSGSVEVGTYPGEMVGGGLETERQLICACAEGTP